MKILRLGTSGDFWPGVPAEQRTAALLSAALQRQTGEVVTTTVKALWPGLPAIDKLNSLLASQKPDVVVVWVNPFWFAYGSAPLRIQRRLGAPGRAVGRLAVRTAERSPICRTAIFRRAQRLMRVTVGVEYHFEPSDVADHVESWLRVILRQESVIPIVISAWHCELNQTDPIRFAAGESRRRDLNRRLRPLCNRLSVHCLADDDTSYAPTGPHLVAEDGMHPNATMHRWMADAELPLHMEAWRQLRNDDQAATTPPPAATSAALALR